MIAEIPMIESDSVPMETRQICCRKSSRSSFGLEMDPRRAFGDKRTCWKVVIAWSRGFVLVPGRVGRTRDMIPRRIWFESHSETTKGLIP